MLLHISAPLLVCFFQRSACFCCPTFSASAYMLRLLFCLTSPLHFLISSFYCYYYFFNWDLPGTKHKEEEHIVSEFLVVSSVKDPVFINGCLWMNELLSSSLPWALTRPWMRHLIKNMFSSVSGFLTSGCGVCQTPACVKWKLRLWGKNGTRKERPRSSWEMWGLFLVISLSRSMNSFKGSRKDKLLG